LQDSYQFNGVEMKKIVSTGVKGGVGKSTFAILLGFKLSKEGKKVVLCDCDVECPNDHLILNKKLMKGKKIYQNYPVLDSKKCKKCGYCSENCRENAIFWVKDKEPFFIYDLCTGCGACWLSCPNKAIKTKKKSVGETYTNKINKNFWLFSGISKTGVSETGPIVRETKNRAIKFAEKKKADYIIFDTSPGMHCSVIQVLLNTDKVYSVTEPTPLGSHDLGLMLKLLQRLGIPGEIVLNKADVGKREMIEKIAKDFNTRITYSIPYSEKLVKAYCEKKLEKVVDLL